VHLVGFTVERKKSRSSKHVMYNVTDYKTVPICVEFAPCIKLFVMIRVFYDTDKLLSCALFLFPLFSCIIFFILSVIFLSVELYTFAYFVSETVKVGCGPPCFNLYVYVVCSSFLFLIFVHGL